MNAALTIVAWVLATPMLVMFGTWLVEVAVGAWPSRGHAKIGHDAPCPRTIILMPAHNEARGIAATLAALAPQLNDHVQLLVIADNCSDDTATLARAAGAKVLERHNETLRGKGYALAFGQDHLRANPPEVVIILDADCTAEPGAIAQLAREAIATQAPVQGLYLLQPTDSDSPMVQISNFAFLIKNLVRQRGGARIGAAAILGGTGMAFPWNLFAHLPLATSDLVEDLALGLHCTRVGATPRFCVDAKVVSMPAAEGETLGQRTRWEHGFISTALRHGLPLVAEGIVRLSPRLVWMGLHLMVPPLALLMVLGVSTLTALGTLALLGASAAPLISLLTLMSAAALALSLAWHWNGRDTISAATLARIPGYIAWKLGIYRKLVGGRQTEWVRTKRLDE